MQVMLGQADSIQLRTDQVWIWIQEIAGILKYSSQELTTFFNFLQGYAVSKREKNFPNIEKM